MYFISIVLLFECCYFIGVESILGGHDIQIENAPYQVNYGDICGGVLIHQRYALTTAHCGSKTDYIRIGNKYRLKGPKIKIANHILNPEFGKRHEFDYDIQILELKNKLVLNNVVNIIPICSGNCGKQVFVTGWGYKFEKGDYNNALQQVQVSMVPKALCQAVDKSWYNQTLTSRMFCAGGGDKDACQGDSGGPAVSCGKLVGLSSFGYGCGRGRIPGVYINVTEPEIREWIRMKTGV